MTLSYVFILVRRRAFYICKLTGWIVLRGPTVQRRRRSAVPASAIRHSLNWHFL